MDYTYWLILIVAVIVFANIVTWLIRKNAAEKTFTGNVDSSGYTETPSTHSSSNIAPGNAEEAVRALLDGGNKIEAIKLVREQTGLGLKEAKDLVDAMERGAAVSIQPGTDSPVFHGDVDSEARRLVAAGKVIDAIKLVRAQNNLGLKEAKDYVERL
jgi:ribosomal protein L7/L12